MGSDKRPKLNKNNSIMRINISNLKIILNNTIITLRYISIVTILFKFKKYYTPI